MSKSPVKLTIAQINEIKSLYNEGHSAPDIHRMTKIHLNIIKYHIERVLLAQIVPKESPSKYTDYKNVKRKLIDIIAEL